MSYFVLLIHESHRSTSMDGGCFKNEGSVFDCDWLRHPKPLLAVLFRCPWGTHGYFPYSSKTTQQLKIKKPQHIVLGLCYLNLAMSYFHMGNPTLSSALTGFTSEFEKGSGGSQSLLSPENWSEDREYVVPHALQ